MLARREAEPQHTHEFAITLADRPEGSSRYARRLLISKAHEIVEATKLVEVYSTPKSGRTAILVGRPLVPHPNI